MHPLSFALKRAHLRTTALGHQALAPIGLTPARFDILYALHHDPCRCRFQHQVAKVLDLTAATISKSLERLEELGLVVRERWVCDRRKKAITLTTEGIRRLEKAVEWLITRGLFRLAFESAFDWPRPHGTYQVECLIWQTTQVARTFRDTSTLRYLVDFGEDALPLDAEIPWGHASADF
jgi:DNA-binding MarR family transcriptional regulator